MTDHRHLTTVQVETIAGLTAGAVATLTVHPLDIIKTRLQVQHGTAATAASAPARTLTILGGLLRNDRPIRSLYRGLSPNLMGNAGSWAVFFGVKSTVERQMAGYRARRIADDGTPSRTTELLSPLDYFGASGSAGVIITLTTNPIWVLKTRMLSCDRDATGAYQSIWHGARQIWHFEGLRGFYKGLGVSLLSNSHGAVQFGVYEPLKGFWRHYQSSPALDGPQDPKLSITATLVISGTAKVIAGSVTYPLQVLRSRLQAHHAEHVFGDGIVEVSRRVWKDQGWRGFYKGLSVNIVRVLPATWVTFLVYENVKHHLSVFL